MGATSRRKGVRGEQAVVHIFEDAGIPAKRTAPLQAGIRGTGADVALEIPGFHVECKMAGAVRIVEWMRQAEREAPALDVPVLAWRLCKRGNSSPWYGNLLLEDLAVLIKRGSL